MSLYLLSTEYLNALDVLTDPENDLDHQTIADTLESFSEPFEDKAVNVAMYARNLDADAAAIKEAINAMRDRQKSLESKSERLKEYLKDNMELSGITKISRPLLQLSVAKNPASVEIFDESMIPKSLMREKIMVEPDKTAIKDALKNGDSVPGARLKTGTRLGIK